MLTKFLNRFKKSQAGVSDRSKSWIFGTMLAFGVLGFIAAFTLSVEKVELLQNPTAQLTCNFNLVLNCATVMQTPQASVFGFPNSFLGIMGYAIVITVAVASLMGTVFPRRFMVLAQVGYGLGLIFAYWLFFTSVYVIQVLCPWCLLVTLATTVLFETLLRYNLRQNNFGFGKSLNTRVQAFLDKDYDKLIVASWLLLMAVLVVLKFGDGLFA